MLAHIKLSIKPTPWVFFRDTRSLLSSTYALFFSFGLSAGIKFISYYIPSYYFYPIFLACQDAFEVLFIIHPSFNPSH